MKDSASRSAPSAEAEKSAAWLDRWMKSTSRAGAMSQRKASAIEAKGGGMHFADRAARAAGVHLVLLTDDKGVELVAASRHPFKVIA